MCGACDEGRKLERSISQKKQRNILEVETRSSDKDMSLTKSSNVPYAVVAENKRNFASRSGSFHQRSLTSPIPCTTRRIIFPSLYDGSKQQRRPSQASCLHMHDHGKAGQPVTVSDADKSLPHMRANSLDGILIPLPGLSPGSVVEGSCSRHDDAKQEDWSTPRPITPPPLKRNVPRTVAQDRPPPQSRCAAQDPTFSSSLAAAKTTLDVPLRPRSRSIILGDVLRHRTYYPAATIPTPVDNINKKSPSNANSSKPLTSILRRRLPLVAPPPPPTTTTTTAAISRRASAPNIATSSLPKVSTPRHQLSKSLSIPPPCLSLTVPTLASPASIISLHSHHDSHRNSCSGCDHPHDGNGSSSIGESECDLVRITDIPKVLPRSQQCTLRKIQSDTIVASMEEDARSRTSRRESVLGGATAVATATPCHEKSKNGNRGGGGGRCNSVSRHVSLESLGTSKRVSFDPHIIVYEFGIADYEKRGGDKWWGEEELAQFKQEAIQRIRLRSTKVIPTGTGRAFAVPTKKGGGEGKAATAAISFNHPALRCCEDELFDSECGKMISSSSSSSSSSKQSMLVSCLTQEIRNILVVDPHEIFLALFTKSLRYMFPHASVATARSADEALTRIRAAQCAFPQSDGGSMHGFDIIIIEEKLLSVGSHSSSSLMQHSIPTQPAGDDSIQRRCSISSGSGLIRHLIESELYCQSSSNNHLEGRESEMRSRFSLLVGVSTHLSEHREKLERAGADCVWGKPPPEMNNTLRNDLLETLLKKRKKQVKSDMFDT